MSARQWQLGWLAAILALGVFGALLPPRGFFVGDSGAKYLQAHAIAETAGWPKLVRYPGGAIDPQRRLVDGDLIPRGDGLIEMFPFLLAVVTAFPLWLAGDRLLLLPALVGGIVAASCAARLARRLAPERRTCQHPAVFLLATPLAFYSLVLWEHSLAAATVFAAVLLLVQADEGTRPWQRWFGGGFLLGTAFWFRTEVIFLLPVLALPLVKQSPTRLRSTGLTLSGAAAALVAGILLQRLVIGEWTPVHVLASVTQQAAVMGRADARLSALHNLYLPDFWLSLGLIAWLAALILKRLLESRRATVAAGVGSMVLTLAAVFVAPSLRLLAGATPTVAFPFRAAPPTWVVLTALPVMLATARDTHPLGRIRALIGFTVVAAVLGELLVLPMFGEYQWGPRYLLAPLLLLVTLEVSTVGAGSEDGILPRVAIGVAIVAGVVVQCLGLGFLHHATRGNADLVKVLLDATAEHGVVASDSYAFAQLVTPVWQRRTVLLVAAPQDWQYFLAGLNRARVTTWWWVDVEGFDHPAPARPELRSPEGSRWVRASEQTLHAGGRTLRLLRYSLVREGREAGGQRSGAAGNRPLDTAAHRAAEPLLSP